MASATEVLRHRDVAELSARERAELSALFAQLHPRAPRRRAHRHEPWRRGSVDARRTLREQLRRMGEPGTVQWRRRGHRARRVVLLIDVSGSMSAYADALLRLAHTYTAAGLGVEVFTIGTRLTHVTRSLRHRDPERALVAAGAAVPDWSGGTRLADGLRAFLDRWGRRGMARGAVVVVFSDGWERDHPEALGEQMRRLQALAHRVVWVNPHRGKAGYQPLQQGIVAALPFVDDFVAGHSWPRSSSSRRWWPVRDVLTDLLRWWHAGERVGVGTVVATFRSAPRPAGAAMLVGPEGEAVGSVSGGCVEGAVYESAQEVLQGARPALRRYGVSDDEAYAVGLTCGGSSTSSSRRSARRPSPSSARSPRTSRPAAPSPSRRWWTTPIRAGRPAAGRAARGRRGGASRNAREQPGG